MLSWCTRSRLFLQTKEVFTLLIALVDMGTKLQTQNQWTSTESTSKENISDNIETTNSSGALLTSSAEWIAATIRYLLLGYGDAAAVDDLIEMGIMRSLDKLNKLPSNDDETAIRTCKSLVAALRTLVCLIIIFLHFI